MWNGAKKSIAIPAARAAARASTSCTANLRFSRRILSLGCSIISIHIRCSSTCSAKRPHAAHWPLTGHRMRSLWLPEPTPNSTYSFSYIAPMSSCAGGIFHYPEKAAPGQFPWSSISAAFPTPAALPEQLLNVEITQRIAQLPRDRLQDQRHLEVPALEVVLGSALQLLGHPTQDQRLPPTRKSKVGRRPSEPSTPQICDRLVVREELTQPDPPPAV